eukprot:gene12845-biopygen2004
MRCFVDTAGNCLVKCFSATCDNHAPACIGRLAEPAGDAWDAGAVHVNSRYIDIDACLEMQQAVDVWLDTERKDVNTLSVRSPMGWMEGFATCLDVKHVPAIDGGDDHTLQELSGGALAPLFATVAPPTLKMTVESYFLAEIYNASFDDVSCFADLLEHAGHRVDLGISYAAVSAARVHAPAEGDVEATSDFLLRVLKAQEQVDALTGAVPVAVAAPVPVAGTDILSNVPTAMRRKDLMDAIEQRVMANDASEDDKFLLYLSRYCSAWGIDRVDEAFLLENKPAVTTLTSLDAPSCTVPPSPLDWMLIALLNPVTCIVTPPTDVILMQFSDTKDVSPTPVVVREMPWPGSARMATVWSSVPSTGVSPMYRVFDEMWSVSIHASLKCMVDVPMYCVAFVRGTLFDETTKSPMMVTVQAR